MKQDTPTTPCLDVFNRFQMLDYVMSYYETSCDMGTEYLMACRTGRSDYVKALLKTLVSFERMVRALCAQTNMVRLPLDGSESIGCAHDDLGKCLENIVLGHGNRPAPA